MTDDERDLLIGYIEGNVAPILVDFVEGENVPNSIVLPANIEKEDLSGHYENTEFCPPEWLNRIINYKELEILVIDKIDSIPKEEQLKFIEILKYRQVSTFKLPENIIIIVTAEEIKETTINEEIYSLVAHIKG